MDHMERLRRDQRPRLVSGRPSSFPLRSTPEFRDLDGDTSAVYRVHNNTLTLQTSMGNWPKKADKVISRTHKYYYLTRFLFAFHLIALFFAVCALFLGLLALCSRIGSFLSSFTCSIALFFQTLAASLMTYVLLPLSLSLSLFCPNPPFPPVEREREKKKEKKKTPKQIQTN